VLLEALPKLSHNSLVEAIFALIGVIVGALIAGVIGVTRVLRREAQNLRAALRLVDEETGLWRSQLEETLDHDVWQPGLIDLPSDQWFAHRKVLAARLASVDWDPFASNALALEAIRNIVPLGTLSQSSNALPPPLSADHRKTVEKGVEALKETQKLLKPLHAPNPRYRGLVRWNYTERKRERQARRGRPSV
jgi:hypothetical protein